LVNPSIQLILFLFSFSQFDYQPTFHSVIQIIEKDVLPIVLRHALVGEARVICHAPRHGETFGRPLALDMMVDVMYDRGFSVRNLIYLISLRLYLSFFNE